MAKKRSRTAPSIKTETVDLSALRQRPDWPDIQILTAFSEGDRARAGSQIGRVLQRPVDRYYAHDKIQGHQWQAAEELYRDYVDTMPANTGFDGVFIATTGARSVSQKQLDASISYNKAIKAIGGRERPIVEGIVIAENTINFFAMQKRAAHRTIWKLFRAGLDDLARHYSFI